jgi:peroxiredoxin
VELPRLQELWQRYRDRGLSVVAVEANRDTERATQFIAEHGPTFHLLEDQGEDNVVSGLFMSPGFPSSYLIDEDGRILYAHTDFEAGDEAVLEQQILELLGASSESVGRDTTAPG